MDRKKDAQEAHNDGQEDRANDPPASFMDIVTLGFGSNSTYDPPKDPELADAYNRGWKNKK